MEREDSYSAQQSREMANCKAVPVGVKGKLNSQNGYAVTSRRHGKMLPDVVMVQMYSKSANVNDLGLHG